MPPAHTLDSTARGKVPQKPGTRTSSERARGERSDGLQVEGQRRRGPRPTARGGQLQQATKARIWPAACARGTTSRESAAWTILRPVPSPSSMREGMEFDCRSWNSSQQACKAADSRGAAAQLEVQCEGASGRKWCGHVAHLWQHRPGPLRRAAGSRVGRHVASESGKAARRHSELWTQDRVG